MRYVDYLRAYYCNNGNNKTHFNGFILGQSSVKLVYFYMHLREEGTKEHDNGVIPPTPTP